MSYIRSLFHDDCLFLTGYASQFVGHNFFYKPLFTATPNKKSKKQSFFYPHYRKVVSVPLSFVHDWVPGLSEKDITGIG